jgi:hypothetical protein
MHFKSFIWMCVPTWKNYLHLLANWMHSKSFICHDVSTWKDYLHLLTNWMHFKNLICEGGPTWKNYLQLLANWMHSINLFIKLLQLESVMKKYIHLWANWMHSKCFICQGVPIWNNYFHLLVIECTWKSWFVWMLQLAKMISMYIDQLNAVQKF